MYQLSHKLLLDLVTIIILGKNALFDLPILFTLSVTGDEFVFERKQNPSEEK
jgi:hypothetical protein